MSYFEKLLNINIFIFILQFLKNMDNFGKQSKDPHFHYFRKIIYLEK